MEDPFLCFTLCGATWPVQINIRLSGGAHMSRLFYYPFFLSLDLDVVWLDQDIWTQKGCEKQQA